jgi:imidazolonepropionase-like amidohydrolase
VGDTAFQGVSVVQVDNGTILADQTVLVRDGVVRYLADSAEVELSREVSIIEGDGLYLAPGLADMHVHFESPEIAPLFLAYGITRVRVMWGAPEILALREEVASGQKIGPEIITAGPIIDGPPVYWPGSVSAASEEEGRRAVRTQIAEGYDFVKVYSRLSPEVFAAIADEARRWGIPVAGHVPDAVSIPEALAAGITSMEHMLGYNSLTLDEQVDLGERRSPERIQIGRALVEGQTSVAELLSLDRLNALAATIAEAGVAVTPTLHVMDRLYLPIQERRELLKRPEARFLSPDTLAFWDPANDKRISDLSDLEIEGLGALIALSERQTLALAEAGVPLLVGSDTPNPFVFYGLGLHEEMERLVQAGLQTADVVRAATLGAAKFTQDDHSVGRVRPGYRADLVLLADNPLANVRNYRLIRGVMKSGVWFDDTGIKELKRIDP